MNISNRISSFAHIAAAAIRRALACCFPCCCCVSNSDETPATAEAGSERRVSHTGSAGSEGSVVSQLAGYNNDGFQQESEDDTESLDQCLDITLPSPASTPASSRVATPELPRVEPIIVPARAVLLGTGTQTGAQAANTSHPEESDTSSQAHTSDSTSSPKASPATQKPASASSTPTGSPVPAPRKPLSQAQKAPPPVPPERKDSLSPKPSTSKAASAELPPPEPKENRLISVRSIPKVTTGGVSGVGFKEQQQTLFAVTTEHKIIRKRQDPPRPQPMGAVMKAKVDLGVEKKPKPLPPKPTPSEGMKDKIALFEPKPAKEEGDEESQSEAGKKRQDSTAGSSGRGKKTA